MPTAPEEMTPEGHCPYPYCLSHQVRDPAPERPCGRAARRGDLYARIPQCRCRARSGRFQSHLAGVAVLRRGAGQLVPTVRPPRLGGNTRMGVFATRSPFRPNPLGLSSVRLEGIEHRPDVGPVLIVRGADLMDGTPSTISSPISPTPTATRTPPRASRGRPSPTICR